VPCLKGWGVTNGNQSQTLAVSRIYMARELGQAAHLSRKSMALGPGSWEYIYVDQERESSGFTDIWLGSPDKSRLGRGAGNMDVAQRVDPFR